MKPLPATFLLGLIMIALSALAVNRGLWAQSYYVAAPLLVVLLWLSWDDFTELRLPDYLTLPLIATGLVWATFVAHEPLSALLGAISGYIIIWALGTYWERNRGQQGIGLGDAKLLSAAGAWLGWMGLPLMLMVASAAGLVAAGLGSVVSRRQIEMSHAIPFGPFLALGFWMVWCFGSDPSLWLK